MKRFLPFVFALAFLVGGSATVVWAQEAAAEGGETPGAVGNGEALDEAAAEGEPTAGEEAIPVEHLNITQGRFLLQLIHDVGAEKYFEGALSAIAAARAFADIGFAPEGGWNTKEMLTRDHLVWAYKRMVSREETGDAAAADEGSGNKQGGDSSEDDEDMGAPEEAEGGVDETDRDAQPAEEITKMSITELLDKIRAAVQKAFAEIDTERLPVSPTGATWTY